jgi:hypothetical protein
MVLIESPSRMVKCSKYIGRVAGMGAPAIETVLSPSAAQATKRLAMRLQFHMKCPDYSGCGTSTPV